MAPAAAGRSVPLGGRARVANAVQQHAELREGEQARERNPKSRGVAWSVDLWCGCRPGARSSAVPARLDRGQVLATRLTSAARLGDEIIPGELQRERCRLIAGRREFALERGEVIHARRASFREACPAHEDQPPLDRQLRDQRLHRLDVAVVPGELAQTCSAECRCTQA